MPVIAGLEPAGREIGLLMAPSAASAVRRHTLIGQPKSFRRGAALPEHIYRDAAARKPIAADAQPTRLGHRDEPPADGHGAVLVERPVVTEGAEIELQRLGLDQPI